METGRDCAYNVTRNVLLSERVWCAAESLEQAAVLELVMNGPALDRHAAVWIRRVPGWVDLPRLFALDFVYLDRQQRIVEAGGVGPGIGFPATGEEVAGALILANRRLEETGTAAGEQVRICGPAELAALVKASSSSAAEAETARTPSPAGQVSAPAFTPFQVSRYSEFVFEPFAGSLVYLPEAGAQPPQSSEFFLPDRTRASEEETVAAEPAEVEQPSPAETAASIETEAKGARFAARRQRQTRKKTATPQEEPHFYTPKPIRFFDAAASGQKAGEDAAAMEERPAREPTQLSPELKAAILQIDEQLRREKEELAAEKKKGHAKERKRKPKRKIQAEGAEEEAVEAAHPAWEELAEPARPSVAMIAAEAEVVEEILEEAEMAAKATLELRPEPRPATEIELSPEIVVEAPLTDSGTHEDVVPSWEMEPQVEESPLSDEAVAYEGVSAAEEISPSFEPAAREYASSEEEIPFLGEVKDTEFAPFVEEIPSADEAMAPAPVEAEVIAFASSVETTEAAEVLPIQKAPAQAPIKSAAPVHAPVEEAKPAKAKPSLGKRLQKWIGREIGDKRRGERTAVPGLVAFYWSGGAPRPHEVVNISKSGFYLRTKELWLPDTLVRMTLQRPEEEKGSGRESIRVLARVVRIDDGGVGHEFVTTDALRHVRGRDVLPADGTNPKELEKFLKDRD